MMPDDNKKRSKVMIVCGARPNFMKVSPLTKAMKKAKIDFGVIDTGQHFDRHMSLQFFEEFDIKPSYRLSPSRETAVRQMTDIMVDLERIFGKERPALVIVVGDVNSTLAGALVANKMGIRLAHIEAGLRSYNRKMPEESNRIVTDHLSDILFATSEEAVVNLRKEGISDSVFLVGNMMIDTLAMFIDDAGSTEEEFYFCTLHRAENVDDKNTLSGILDALEVISKDRKIYLPLHPRTEKMARKFGFFGRLESIFSLLSPLSYKQSVFRQKNAKLVLTDSGGVQEETSYLGVPCLTLRTETERPITVEMGTNTIAGITGESIIKAYNNKDLKRKKVKIPFWDAKASERIVKIIKDRL